MNTSPAKGLLWHQGIKKEIAGDIKKPHRSLSKVSFCRRVSMIFYSFFFCYTTVEPILPTPHWPDTNRNFWKKKTVLKTSTIRQNTWLYWNSSTVHNFLRKKYSKHERLGYSAVSAVGLRVSSLFAICIQMFPLGQVSSPLIFYVRTLLLCLYRSLYSVSLFTFQVWYKISTTLFQMSGKESPTVSWRLWRRKIWH